MKRRKFLSMIGAATTAPLMPSVSVAAPPQMSVALKGAIAHAKASPYVSSWGLMHRLGVSAEEASALITDLSKRGLVAPVKGLRKSSQWAHSQAYVPPVMPKRRVKPKHQQSNSRRARQQPQPEPQTDLMMAHLRQIAADYFAAKAHA